jgi:hypothetical protein
MNWFCSKQFGSYEEASSAGGSLGIPIDVIPVSIGGYDSQSNWSQYQSELCARSNGQFSHTSEIKSSVRKASESIVSAWNNCMNAVGTHASLRSNADGTFTLVIKRAVDDANAKPNIYDQTNRTHRRTDLPTVA